MNASNAKDYLPLVQALIEGKTLQKNTGFEKERWEDVVNAHFSGPPKSYRIKPEPSPESLEMANYLEEMAKSIREMKVQPHDITNTVNASGCGTIYNVTFIYSVRT